MSCTKFIIMKVKLGKHPLLYMMYSVKDIYCYVAKKVNIEDQRKIKQRNIKREKRN